MFLAGDREFNLHLAGALSTYSVTSYGAKGDGSTDDTAAIQAAINAAYAAGGGVVYLPVPDEYYLLESNLDIPAGVSLQGLPPRRGARFGFIGDSITQQGFVRSGSGDVLENIGYATWLRQLSKQRINANIDSEFAENGATTNTIVTDYLNSAMTAGLDYCVVAIGTNDTDGSSISFAATTANLETIYINLLAMGITPVAVPPLPRAHDDSTERNEHERIAWWVRTYAQNNTNIILADPTPVLIDAGNSDGEMLSGYTFDDLHPSPAGAYYIGKTIWEAVEPYIPKFDMRVYSAGDVYHSSENPQGNLLSNGNVEGTGGTAGTGVSGDVADNMSIAYDSASGIGTFAITASKVARTDGEDGEWQQLVAAGTPTSSRNYRFYETVSASGKYEAGDVLEGMAEYEIDTGHSGLRSVELVIRDRNSGSSTVFTVVDGDEFATTGYFVPDDGAKISGVFRTPSFVANNDPGNFVYELIIQAQASQAISATVRFGRISVRKVA